MGQIEYTDYVYYDLVSGPAYMIDTTFGSDGSYAHEININVRDDSFLNTFIEKLDEELYSETPNFKEESTKMLWNKENLKDVFTILTDEVRKHGWAVLQGYNSDDEGIDWKVYSPVFFNVWLTEVDADGRNVRTGVKFTYHDELDNHYDLNLIFNPQELCFLVVWKESSYQYRYAEADLSQAILTAAYRVRQVNTQLSYASAKPWFYHFKYGGSADADFVTSLQTEMKKVCVGVGIGAKVSNLEEIVKISTGEIDKIDKSLDKMIQIFAGATRLPLRFYIGERKSNGLSDAGESMDERRINNKKTFIFNRMFPYMKEIMLFGYGIIIDVEVEEDEEDNKDEQEYKETDQR